MKRLAFVAILLLSTLFSFSQRYINVKGQIRPVGGFPIIISDDIKGGIHKVADINERNALPVSYQDTGMLVYVRNIKKTYQLQDSATALIWASFGDGKLTKVNDSTYLIGADTLKIKSNGGIIDTLPLSNRLTVVQNTKLDTLKKSVTTRAALMRLLLSPQADVIYQFPSDEYEGGNWYFSPGDTASDNTGTRIRNAAGVFYRIINKATGLNIRWYLKSAGDSLTDVSSAFAAMKADARRYSLNTLYLPAGKYVSSTNWNLWQDSLTITGDGIDKTILLPPAGTANGYFLVAPYRDQGWTLSPSLQYTFEDTASIGQDYIRMKAGQDLSAFTPGTKIYINDGASYYDQYYGQLDIVHHVSGNVVYLVYPLGRDYTSARGNYLGTVLTDFVMPAVGSSVTVSIQQPPAAVNYTSYSINNNLFQCTAVSGTSATLLNLGKGNAAAGTTITAGSRVMKGRSIILAPSAVYKATLKNLTLVGRRRGITISNTIGLELDHVKMTCLPSTDNGQLWLDGDGGIDLTMKNCIVSNPSYTPSQFARSFGLINIFDCQFINAGVDFSEFNWGFRVYRNTFKTSTEIDSGVAYSAYPAITVGTSTSDGVISLNTISVSKRTAINTSPDIQVYSAITGSKIIIDHNTIHCDRSQFGIISNRPGNVEITNNVIDGSVQYLFLADGRKTSDTSNTRDQYGIFTFGNSLKVANNSFSGKIDGFNYTTVHNGEFINNEVSRDTSFNGSDVQAVNDGNVLYNRCAPTCDTVSVQRFIFRNNTFRNWNLNSKSFTLPLPLDTNRMDISMNLFIKPSGTLSKGKDTIISLFSPLDNRYGTKAAVEGKQNMLVQGSGITLTPNNNNTTTISSANSGGTVTNFSKSDGFAISSSVSNPSTTPVYSSGVDSAALFQFALRRKDSALYATQTSLLPKVNYSDSLSFLQTQAATKTAVVTKRATADTVVSPLFYRLASGFTDNTSGIQTTPNRGFVFRPNYTFSANNQAYVGVVIDPNQIGTTYSGNNVSALGVNGNITQVYGSGTGTIGTPVIPWYNGYFSSLNPTTVVPANIQIPSTNTIMFKTFNGIYTSAKFGDTYGSWVMGNGTNYSRTDQARLSFQFDQYAVTGYGGAIAIDDTIRSSLSGDTLFGIKDNAIYDTGKTAIFSGHISGAGTGFTNGTYSQFAIGGSGSDARLNITVSGGAVTGVVILSGGKSYKKNDLLSAAAFPGFQWLVDSVGLTGVKRYGLSLNEEVLFYKQPNPSGPNYSMLVYDSTSKTMRQVARSLFTTGTGTTTNPLTFKSDGTGAAPNSTFNGGVAQPISYNSIGAQPLINPVTSGILFGTGTAGVMSSSSQFIYYNGKLGLNTAGAEPATSLDLNGAFTLEGLMSAPATPATGSGVLWIDKSSGKSILKIKFPDGSNSVIASQP